MLIKELKLTEIKPYEKNPRRNDESVKYVAESIKQFGFRVPIVIDKDNVIVCGHTRYKAAKKLNYKTVPCIMADDLTDEQINAYRLADNKVSEKSEWDNDLLISELEDLKFTEIDMGDFGFEMDVDFEDNEDNFDLDFDLDEEKESHRLATDRAYNLQFNDISRTVGYYQIPVIKNDNYIPKDLISFNYAKSAKDKNIGIHFYVDDYQFERVWTSPEIYAGILQEFDCIVSPDFSLYLDMPIAMKIWNVYRSRLIGQIMQDYGIKVIPNVSWAEKETFQFCFDGIEQGSVVSISTIGVKRDPAATAIWRAGVTEMIKRIKPKAILVYGGKIEYDYPKDIDVIYFENKTTERMKNSKIKEDL